MRASSYIRAVIVLTCLRLTVFPGCGAFPLPSIAFNDNDNTEDACLDIWSLVHFGSGSYLRSELGGDSFGPTLMLLAAYEAAEPEFWPAFNESRVNQQCDVVVGMCGWLAQ